MKHSIKQSKKHRGKVFSVVVLLAALFLNANPALLLKNNLSGFESHFQKLKVSP